MPQSWPQQLQPLRSTKPPSGGKSSSPHTENQSPLASAHPAQGRSSRGCQPRLSRKMKKTETRRRGLGTRKGPGSAPHSRNPDSLPRAGFSESPDLQGWGPCPSSGCSHPPPCAHAMPHAALSSE
ncbi:hypothetical protein MC885_021846, partial [Smutsia gigantea]